jgi:hypothetical protein
MFRSPCSGYDVWNDLVFDLGDLVLDRQLFLLHALDAQLIASRLNHGVNGNVEVFVLMAQRATNMRISACSWSDMQLPRFTDPAGAWDRLFSCRGYYHKIRW